MMMMMKMVMMMTMMMTLIEYLFDPNVLVLLEK